MSDSLGGLLAWTLSFWLIPLGLLTFGWWAYNPLTGAQMVFGGLGLKYMLPFVVISWWAPTTSPMSPPWYLGFGIGWLAVAWQALRLRRSWTVSERERRPDEVEVWWSRRRLATHVAASHTIAGITMLVLGLTR